MKYIEWNIDRITSTINFPELPKSQTHLYAAIGIDDFEVRPIERTIPCDTVKARRVGFTPTVMKFK